MSLGFVNNPGRGNVFTWLGDKVKAAVSRHIEDKMFRTGEAVVSQARALAPVDTGFLRSSIDYVVAPGESGMRSVLSIQVGAPYGVFQEFGTRTVPPHPYIRPALNMVGRIWGFDVQMAFNAPGGPGGGRWHGLLAGKRGIAASASPHWRPLTEKQVRHVESRVIPGIRKHNKGNAKRSTLSIGRRYR